MSSVLSGQPLPASAGAESAPDPTLAQAIDAYETAVTRSVAGELDIAQFKPLRASHGVYEQRRDGTFMVRSRVPGGLLSVAQAQTVAAAATELGGGYVHVTTRQDVQIHDASLTGTVQVMRRLQSVGLACHGTGGNTVRNVLVCPFAGVCPREQFDVRPAVAALNRVLPGMAAAYKLPRKFKIGVSGCAADCALAAFTDLGLVACRRDGQPGFAVFAGGGMGMNSRVADRLEEWIAPTELATVTRALISLFDRHGDRENRAKARLRYAFDRLGFAALQAEYAAEKAAHPVPLPVPVTPVVTTATCADPRQPWRHEQDEAGLRVVPQRQAGYVSVALHPPLGLLTAANLQLLATAAAEFSEEQGLCLTPAQGILLRQVRRERLPALALALAPLPPEWGPKATPLAGMIVCTSADTCRLGACLSRDTARTVAAALAAAAISREVLDAVDIRISGCGNSCAQSPVADIGLNGVARRVDGVSRPHYRLLLGARRGTASPGFAKEAAVVDAEALPGTVVRLVQAYAQNRLPDEAFTAFIERAGAAVADALGTQRAS